MTIKKKFGACLSALALSASVVVMGGLFSPASAADTDTDGDGIDQFFEQSDWYNQRNPNEEQDDALDGNAETRWMYENYPVTCTPSSSTDRAYKAIFAYTEGTTPWANTSTENAFLRKIIRGGLSGVAATAQRAHTNYSSLANVRAPRIETYGSAPNCNPAITNVALPASAFGSLTSLQNALIAKGYDRIDRKYAVFTRQSTEPCQSQGQTCGGVAQMNQDYSGQGDALSHPANSRSYLWTGVLPYQSWGETAQTFMHELTHSLGAVHTTTKNYNAGNYGHPRDCFDILCYDSTNPLANDQFYVCGYNSSGGSVANQDGRSRQSYRLDCNDDDYYARSGATIYNADGSVAWNTAKSSFLTGNPQPTGTVSLASRSVVETHAKETGPGTGLLGMLGLELTERGIERADNLKVEVVTNWGHDHSSHAH